jgi:predicted AlkP superfamily pyrophosphatase or phosphodiesterase
MHKSLLLLVFVTFQFLSTKAQDTTQKIITQRENAKEQTKKPYVVLISIDGFRSDFTELHNASFLSQMSKKGVRAAYMTPSYPSSTFPNHYSIVTGMYPSHHGLVDNSYYDATSNTNYSMNNKAIVGQGKWYGGTPLWVLAEQQNMLSASFYWVGSEADIKGVRPTYYYVYNEKIQMAQRINAVKNWLSLPENIRPHLITFYLPQVDHEAHDYGPNDVKVYNAVQMVDSSINALVNELALLHLPINYIVVSDHGMTKIDVDKSIKLPKAIDTSFFKVPWGDALVHVYAKPGADINATMYELKKDTSFDTFLPDQTPAYWHYRKSDDRYNRIGDILLVPKLPGIFNFSSRKPTPGKHGFDNNLPDMRATFIAWGPAFKQGTKISGFENVNVYPLIAHILGLQFDEKQIDGKFSVLQSTLKH